MAAAFNPSTWESGAGSFLKASLIYLASSKTAITTDLFQKRAEQKRLSG